VITAKGNLLFSRIYEILRRVALFNFPIDLTAISQRFSEEHATLTMAANWGDDRSINLDGRAKPGSLRTLIVRLP